MDHPAEQAPMPPKRILLATDMTSRCDRATERALLLAREWAASIVALHVLVPNALAGPEKLTLDRLKASVSPDTGDQDVLTLIEEGEAAEVTARIARVMDCGLIVTGLTSFEGIERFFMNDTADKILQLSATPLLITKLHTDGPYHKIVVAIDFSEASRLALELAAQWFPWAMLTLFHAYDTPFSAFISDEDEKKNYQEAVAIEYKEFLAHCPAYVKALPCVFEPGSPSRLLADHVVENGIDLVIAAQSPSDLFKRLFGTTTRAIKDDIPCDLLVVPVT